MKFDIKPRITAERILPADVTVSITEISKDDRLALNSVFADLRKKFPKNFPLNLSSAVKFVKFTCSYQSYQLFRRSLPGHILPAALKEESPTVALPAAAVSSGASMMAAAGKLKVPAR